MGYLQTLVSNERAGGVTSPNADDWRELIEQCSQRSCFYRQGAQFHGLDCRYSTETASLVSDFKRCQTVSRIESAAGLCDSEMSLNVTEAPIGVTDHQQPLPVDVSPLNGFSASTQISELILNNAEQTTPTDVMESAAGGPGEVTSSTKETPENNDVLQLVSQSLGSPGLRLCTTNKDGEVKLRMDDSGNPEQPPITVHQMFTETLEKFADYVALASKQGEQWKKITFKQYYNECRDAAKSFLKIGLERFNGVGILGFNSPEWFIADIGAILAGGVAVGIYTTNSPEACHYVANDSEANVLVVENNKQLQKILQIQDQLPHLKAIVQYKEELKEKRPNLYTWSEFMQLGKDVPDSQLDEIIASQKPNQCCTLIYTSGTTGKPKGVMLSHDNLTWTANAAGNVVNLRPANESQESIISYLPLSHIAAQMIDIWLSIKFGGTTYFAQPDALKGSLVNTMREVRPTAFMGVPRVWEKMQEKLKTVSAKSSTVRRKVASWAKDVGLKTNLNRMNGYTAVSWNFRLANKLVFKMVRNALGLNRCTKCYTGAAPITKDTLEFFLSLNIPIYELYGMSESSGPHTISVPNSFRLSSCGKVMPGCKTKIFNPDVDGCGEICFWGRHLFMGYLNMEDKTQEAIDEDGWLHSGDLGKHDEKGFLYITGRIKELIITAGGENIPPVPIEDAVKELVPIISNAMLIGDKRKFLSMLLTLKCNVNGETGEPQDDLTEEAIQYCQTIGCKATKVSEIYASKDATVFAAIQEGINHVNEKASSNAQRIQKWCLLEKDFSIPGGELGPTMKLKRPVVLKMYNEQIDDFYKDAITPVTPDNPLTGK